MTITDILVEGEHIDLDIQENVRIYNMYTFTYKCTYSVHVRAYDVMCVCVRGCGVCVCMHCVYFACVRCMFVYKCVCVVVYMYTLLASRSEPT